MQVKVETQYFLGTRMDS